MIVTGYLEMDRIYGMGEEQGRAMERKNTERERKKAERERQKMAIKYNYFTQLT